MIDPAALALHHTRDVVASAEELLHSRKRRVLLEHQLIGVSRRERVDLVTVR